MTPMLRDEMILVSVDDHVVEPRDLFEHHLSPAWKSRAPRVARKKDGSEIWLFEGQQLPNLALSAVVGRPPAEWGVEPTSFEQLRPGTSARDRMRRRRLLGDGLARAAGELLPHMLDHFPVARYVLQALGHVLAELAQGPAAARAERRCRIDDALAR